MRTYYFGGFILPTVFGRIEIVKILEDVRVFKLSGGGGAYPRIWKKVIK